MKRLVFATLLYILTVPAIAQTQAWQLNNAMLFVFDCGRPLAILLYVDGQEFQTTWKRGLTAAERQMIADIYARDDVLYFSIDIDKLRAEPSCKST